MTSLVAVLLKMTLCLCIYLHLQKLFNCTIILSLLKIDTLNFIIYILTILTWPLKIYIIGLHNLISVNIFFTKKIIVQSRCAFVWNARFHHQDHSDFVQHFINVYLLKYHIAKFKCLKAVFILEVNNGGMCS